MIPQPTVVTNQQQYRELQQRQTEGLSQSLQGLANTNLGLKQIAVENARLDEEKRQFDLQNRFNAYNALIGQAGGLSNFIRGTADVNGQSFIENPNARQMFRDLYGSNGDQIFDMTRRTIEDTPEQVVQNALMFQLKNVAQTGSNEIGGGQSPNTGSQGGGTQRDNVGKNVGYKTGEMSQGQSQSQGQQSQQGQVGGGMAQVGSPSMQQQTGPSLGGLAPELNQGTVPASLGGGLSIQIPKSMGSPENRFPVTNQSVMTNKQGKPISNAPEQQTALFPLNTATFKEMDAIRSSIAPKAEGESNEAFNKRAASKMAEWGYSVAGEEGKQLLAQATRGLEVGTPAYNEYDKKAKRLFGIDGKGLMALRGTIFHNIEKGKPVGTLPTEAEAKGQWWWNGNMPYDIPGIEVITDNLSKAEASNATKANVDAAVKDLANNPKATAQVIAQKPDTINTITSNMAKNNVMGLLSSGALKSYTANAMKNSLSDGGGSKRDQAVMRYEMRQARGKVAVASRMVNANPKKALTDAQKKMSSNGNLDIKDTMAVGREQLKAIADELQRYTAGSDDVSAAVVAFAPENITKQRTFAEAKRQYNKSVELEERQFGLSEREIAMKEAESAQNIKASNANIKIAEENFKLNVGYLGIALAEIQLKSDLALAAAKASAVEGTAIDPKVAIDIAKANRDAMIDVIKQGSKGDPVKYNELYTKALKDSPIFKESVETLSKLASGEGVDGIIKQIDLLSGGRDWLGTWFDKPPTVVPYLTPNVSNTYGANSIYGANSVRPNVSVGGQGAQTENPYNQQAGTLTNTYGGK